MANTWFYFDSFNEKQGPVDSADLRALAIRHNNARNNFRGANRATAPGQSCQRVGFWNFTATGGGKWNARFNYISSSRHAQ